METLKKRGKCLTWSMHLYTITGLIGVVCLYAWSFVAKERLFDSDVADLNLKRALFIDSMQLVFFAVFFTTLMAALLTFKMLDRRHNINFKSS